MSHDYDADVRKLDGDELLACPSCGTFMLPLRGYEISKSEAPSVDGDWQTFLIFGWTLYVWNLFFNFVDDLFTLKSRLKKLAQLKKDVLTSWPNSLICPQCLNVKRRS